MLYRIYNKIKDKFSSDIFIREFLNKAIYNKEIDDEIDKALLSSKHINIIMKFYRDAFEDQNYKINTSKDFFNKETNKMESIVATKPMKIKRYNTLLKWTINIFKDLQNEEI